MEKKKQMRVWLSPILLALLAVAVFLLDRLAQNVPQWVERIYSRGLYPSYAQIVSTLTGLLPVSLSELLLFCFPVLLCIGLVRLIRKKTQWQRFVARWLSVALSAYLLFEGGWALNYSRQRYAEIAGLEVKNVEIDKVEELTQSLALEANALREALCGEQGEPFELCCSRFEVLQRVNPSYDRAAERYPWLGGHYGKPKQAILSTPLAYLNIAGIFSPFTLEAHVNAHEAEVLLAATAMHEAAHLRGFAREDEANYIAFLVCRVSDDAYVRYSGTLLGLIYAGNALYSVDPKRFRAIYQMYSEGVISDLRAYNAAWEPYEGKAAEVHEQLNDAYLRSNHQQDGVRSYGRMVDLMIAQREKERIQRP